MKLEEQVCSLELAKCLKELGVKQESYFSWEVADINNIIYPRLSFSHTAPERSGNNLISAFTAAELGELLPNRVTTPVGQPYIEPFNSFTLFINKFYCVDENGTLANKYIINYECDTTDNSFFRSKLRTNTYDTNLANAMTKLLIYLLENKLITINAA